MAAEKYTLYAVSINGTLISGCRSVGITPNLTKDIVVHDGAVNPLTAMILSGAPQFRFSTRDVAGALTAVGINGAQLTALTAYFQQRDSFGKLLSGSNHVKAALTASMGMGLAVLDPISPQHNQPAEIGITIYLGSTDGATNPLTWSFDQALAGSPGAVTEYTLGPAVLTPDPDGTPADKHIPCDGWTFDPGNTVDANSNDGNVYPDFICITEQRPTLTIQSPDLQYIANIPTTGAMVDAYWWLRKMSSTGTGRVAEGTAEHIGFVAGTAGLANLQDLAAQQGAHAEASYMLDILGAVTLDTTSAIDTTPTGA